MSEIWVIGQVTADKVFGGEDKIESLRVENHRPKERVGGKAFNISAAISQMEQKVELITAIGTDLNGDLALRSMKAAHIGYRYVVRGDRRSKPISTPITKLTEGIHGERIVTLELDRRLNEYYLTSLSRAAESIRVGNPAPSMIIYTLEQPHELRLKLVEILRRARQTSKTVIVGNPAPRSDGVPSPIVGEIIRLSDIVVPNKYEANFLLGKEYVDKIHDKEIPKKIREIYGLDAVVRTLGASGWMWSDATSCEGYDCLEPASVGEKVGASDVFVGIMSVLILRGCDLETACLGAGIAAREAVRSTGGHKRFPSRKQLIDILCGVGSVKTDRIAKFLEIGR